MPHPDLDRLGSGTYISLTTYRRDGTAVPTPVWVAREGDHLFVITGAHSGKVKRLRHNDSVLVASCDARGRVEGAAVPGRAVLLEADGTERVLRMVRERYGLLARVLLLRDRFHRGGGRVGLEITVT